MKSCKIRKEETLSKLPIIPTKHFVEKLGERFFDLSIINSIYVEIAKNTNPNCNLFEVSNGNATIVAKFEKDEGVIKLITGWKGNRKKEKFI